MSALVPDRRNVWKPLAGRRPRATPKRVQLNEFSFADAPIKTWKALKEIAISECKETEFYIDFLDRDCLDIAPYLVFGRMQLGLSQVLKGGRIGPQIKKIINAVQLTEFLKMEPFADVKENDDVWAFPLQMRGQTIAGDGKDTPQTKDRVSSQFISSINSWLGLPEIGQELNGDGVGLVGNLIGEVLDNAERHSLAGGEGGWVVAGFMNRRTLGGQERYFCSVGFLSEGDSIAESFRDCDGEIRQKIDGYCAIHRRSGFSEELLTTVCALQDGITSDPEKAVQRRGGTGLQDVIDFVNDLGQNSNSTLQPQLTIMSGSACVRIRKPYVKGTRKDEFGARTLWFNESNDRMQAPDARHVLSLETPFPGTIISMTFVLDPALLRQTIDAGALEGSLAG